MEKKQKIDAVKTLELIETLRIRFEEFMFRHQDLLWEKIADRLHAEPEKLHALYLMESTGGEPDVVAYHSMADKYIFVDCSVESPSGRRSLCYDRAALNSRKANKPIDSAEDVAKEMGIELMTEDEYLALQEFGPFDTKTSSWLKTPENLRSLGGAIFGDFRFGRTFIYCNGAQSYYAARGFRGSLRI